MSGLFGSTILETLIGVAFVYLLLSSISSAIQELLASFLKLRARDLELGIENMLCDSGLAKDVLTHPLIKALGSDNSETPVIRNVSAVGKGGDTTQKARRYFAGKPSYIPSGTFARALLDTLAPAIEGPVTLDRIRMSALAYASDPNDANKQSIGKGLLSLIADEETPERIAQQVNHVKDVVKGMSPSANPQEQDLRAAIFAARTTDEIENLIRSIPPGSLLSPLGDRALQAIETVRTDLHGLRTNLETWYNQVMDRVSGIYKRRIQWWLLVIAVLVTCAVGADTLRIANTLSTNATVRSVLVENARQVANSGSQNVPDLKQLSSNLGPLNELFGYNGWPGQQQPANSSAPASQQQSVNTSAPTGGDWFWWVVWKVLGLALTVFAVSLGAPFWFDVVNKLANIRGAGTPPQTSGQSSKGAASS